MLRIRYLLPLSALLLAILSAANAGQNVQIEYFLNVSFTCHNGNTKPGYSVFISGSRPELGNWDPSKAVLLKNPGHPTWSGRVQFKNVKPGDTLEWKCIIRNEKDPLEKPQWQPDPDNQVTFAFSPEPQAVGTF